MRETVLGSLSRTKKSSNFCKLRPFQLKYENLGKSSKTLVASIIYFLRKESSALHEIENGTDPILDGHKKQLTYPSAVEKEYCASYL